MAEKRVAQEARVVEAESEAVELAGSKAEEWKVD